MGSCAVVVDSGLVEIEVVGDVAGGSVEDVREEEGVGHESASERRPLLEVQH